MTRILSILVVAILVRVVVLAMPPGPVGGALSGIAWADDEDDDGGGGGEDDDDDDGRDDRADEDDDNDDDGDDNRSTRSGRNDDETDGSGPVPRRGSGAERLLQDLFGNPRRTAPVAASPLPPPPPSPPPPPPPPPASAPDEIVTLGLTGADLSVLLAQGFAVIEERPLGSFGTISRRLRIPPDLTLENARLAVRAVPSGQDADFNHFYRSEQGFDPDCNGSECPARAMLDWPPVVSRAGACGSTVPIGMIDTGINDGHDTFADARLEVIRLGAPEVQPSRAIHGTAVAALLVGDPSARSSGLVPGSRLVAVDAFHRSGSDERADLFTLVGALDLLAGRGVSVINLSLAGPPNTVLEAGVTRLVTEVDIVLTAAVGNAGPAAEPAYPAAYPAVIAVTAVDRSGNVYRRAGRGDHVDLAAPGVDVWTAASVSGARWKTGTSFAVPFVTAAVALLREARPDLSAVQVSAELRARARDLGLPGHDETYGAGLVSVETICRPA